MSRRGSLIAFEGIDKSGKTTQANLLVEFLTAQNITVAHIKFPVRTTAIGKVIDEHLKSSGPKCVGNARYAADMANHLIFSANRWEAASDICRLLDEGVTVVLDRYVYSGLAYSIAKGLESDWCKKSDEGLPRPDLTIYMRICAEDAAKRGNFGTETYEDVDFLRNVAVRFNDITANDDDCVRLIATNPVEDLRNEIQKIALGTIYRDKGPIQWF
jgi:dTMP kinase